MPDCRGDRAGEPGARLGDPAVGHRQGLGIGLVLRRAGTTGGHSSTNPACPARAAKWRISAPSSATPSRAPAWRKIASTARSTGSVERNEISSGRICQSWSALATRSWKCCRIAQEGLRVGALKAVDRLLGVADREDRAGAVARALAGEEFLGERRDDLPLFGVGVLRLVDQDVVETAVELEEHPGRDSRASQQVERRQHQIVVIERALEPLAGVIGAQQRVAEPGQRTLASRTTTAARARSKPLHSLCFGGENRRGVAAGFTCRPRRASVTSSCGSRPFQSGKRPDTHRA